MNILKKSDYQFPILLSSKLFTSKNYPSQQSTTSDHTTLIKLITNKGCFPYEKYSTISQMKYDKKFPNKSSFFSKLNQSHITWRSYERGKRLYTHWNCQNMLEYCKKYCILDVILLAECFEYFRNFIFSNFKLDCSKYLSLPSISLDASLLKSNTEFHLITDLKMWEFIEKGIRGGISFINTKYCNALEEHRQMLYFDVTNLYAEQLMEYLPVSNFVWVPLDRYDISYFLNLPKNSKLGYFFNVDLLYPLNIHEKTKMFPLCPAHYDIKYENLSPISKEMFKKFNKSKSAKNIKLTGTHCNIKQYVIHYRLLQFYIKMGMKLDKINSIIQFDQKPCFKSYISKLSYYRKNAKTKSEDVGFKLIMNVLYGKTAENISKYKNLKLIPKSNLEREQRSPNFNNYYELNNDFCISEYIPEYVLGNKLSAIGFTILELSKLKMFDAFYNLFSVIFENEDMDLLMTDTDSFFISVKENALERHYSELKDYIDFSNFPNTHPFFDNSKKKQPGIWKLENGHEKILEFVGLQSKNYSYSILCDEDIMLEERKKHEQKLKRKNIFDSDDDYDNDDKQNSKKIKTFQIQKGIPGKVSKNIKLEIYKNSLFNIKHKKLNNTYLDMNTNKLLVAKYYKINSKHQNLYFTKASKKICVNYSDKRYLHKCKIHSVPLGSSLITKKHECKFMK